mgnify:CR=1 FL=1
MDSFCYICIMKIFSWLFGSWRSVKEMKPSVSEGGNFVTEKSVKKNEIPQKGQFNIMVGYNQQNVLTKKRSGFNENGRIYYNKFHRDWEQAIIDISKIPC